MKEYKAAMALPAVVAVVVLPALLPRMDIPVGDHLLIGERLVYLPATTALGLWSAAKGSPAADAVAIGSLACLGLILAPRGSQWPSYSYADLALCAAVAVALYQLAASQRRFSLIVVATLALSFWTLDSMVLSVWCAAAVAWTFTATTACGSALGDPTASIPALTALALWLFALRKFA